MHCVICETLLPASRNANAKTCSVECRQEHARRRTREWGKNNPDKYLRRHGALKRDPRPCRQCGTMIMNPRTGNQSVCSKECQRERSRKNARVWVEANPERYALQKQRYRHSEAAVDLKIRRLYGAEAGQYRTMYDSQGGACAICAQQAPLLGKGRLHVDHCHASGRIRGLLCHTCNMGLGSFRDNPQLLALAVTYLG